MLIEVDGKEVEVENSIVLEAFKRDEAYNAEVDRIAAKRANTVETQVKANYEATLAQIKADHEAEIENAKKMATGKVSDQMQVLMDANKEVVGTVEQLKADLKAERENGIKSSLKADLANSLAGVKDELVRNTLIETGMKTAVITEDGKALFNVGDGVMAGAKELAESFSQTYPQHFMSNQPKGSGINGGDVAPLPKNATDSQRRAAEINQRLKDKT